MLYRALFFCLVACSQLTTADWSWDNAIFRNMISCLKRDSKKGEEDCEEAHYEPCDENELLKQLACVYVTSPERILLSLTSNCLEETCKSIGQVINNINKTLSDCLPLPEDNLYMKLYEGLSFFNYEICSTDSAGKSKAKQLTNYQECFALLRDDFLDCEGPADWFERPNKAYVCKEFTDIINCEYVRTALLCGLKPARMVREFSKAIMNKVLVVKCKLSSSLPRVVDPMPSAAAYCHTSTCIFILIFCYIIFSIISCIK